MRSRAQISFFSYEMNSDFMADRELTNKQWCSISILSTPAQNVTDEMPQNALSCSTEVPLFTV